MQVRTRWRKSAIVHIGLDDTDSTESNCTTHAAYKIADYLVNHESVEFIDYPSLVRLNPNIPWKTRGNGAICLRFRTRSQDDILEKIIEIIHNESLVTPGANPGLVFYCGDSIPTNIQDFASKALYDVLSRKMAESIIKEDQLRYFIAGNGQGLVGSLAAIGTLLQEDHTFEAIAYRKLENCGTKRKLDVAQIIQYDTETFPYTFNNYDKVHKRILILPHGADPVFCGIRGESAETVATALSKLLIHEKLEGYMVFRTNQGTNLHLKNETSFAGLKCYTAGFSHCKVESKPIVIEGGHAMFKVRDLTGTVINAAVYEPTDLASTAARLDIGDTIKIGFGVRKPTSRHPKILNVEYLQILEVNEIFQELNPMCLPCKKRMKSEGTNKGFRCIKCGLRDRNAKKDLFLKPRMIDPGLYLPTPSAQRHLTKPIHRYGMEKSLGNSPTPRMFRAWLSSS